MRRTKGQELDFEFLNLHRASAHLFAGAARREVFIVGADQGRQIGQPTKRRGHHARPCARGPLLYAHVLQKLLGRVSALRAKGSHLFQASARLERRLAGEEGFEPSIP
jgi:hypothetical protein